MVDPLVVSAQEHQPALRSKLLGQSLVKSFTGWVREDDGRAFFSGTLEYFNRFEGECDWFCADQHACGPTKRGVINFRMAIVAKISRVRAIPLYVPPLSRSAHDAVGDARQDDFWEQGDVVDPEHRSTEY